jgi:hypothetical protein
MADLFNQQISATYSGLLKTSSSGVLSASLSQISDGRGNTSPLYLSTGSIQFYGAYSFPNADGSANQVLKTDGAGVLTWENDSLSNTLNFSGGTGTGSVTLDTQTLAFTGTANEIVTSASSQAITLSFPTAGVTLPNGSIATTQTASDNSTKVATTAYVDNQVSTAGTVTSVALSVPTGLTVTGSPITTSGTIAIGGTLGVANGGTGATTLTGILLGNGTSAISAVTDGATSGQVLSTNGSGTYSFIDAATGDVSISGTPSTNEVAIWTNSNTIKGDAAFQFVTGIQNSIKLIRGTGAGNIKFYAADGTTLHGYIENQVSGNGLTIGQLDGVTSAAIDLDDSTITFKTNSNPHLTISSVGDVTIGSATFGANLGQLRITNAASSNPASLSLFGYDNVVDGGNFAKIDFSMQTTGTGGQPVADIKALAVGTGENAADLVFSTATGGTLSPRLTITSEGKVGIGTDSPNFYGLTFEKILTISSADATTDYAVIELAGGSAAGGGIQFGNQTVRQAGIFSLNGSDLGFYTNSTNSGPDLTEGMRITSGGVLQANYGISFPSPANTSDPAYYSGATTLNAYEEGTWTPVIKFGTTVNSAGNNSVKAVYTRIGRVVYIQCTMTSISLAGTGNLSIEGLPYTVGAATTFGHTQGNFRWGGIALSGSATHISGYFLAGQSKIAPQIIGTSGFIGSVTNSGVSFTWNIYGISGFYMI